MKRILIVLGGLIFILVVLIIVNPPEITFEESKVISPEKPKSVPNNTFWVGGIDGGNYIYIEKYNNENKLFFAHIYNDYTGDIEYEGLLKYSGNRDISESLYNSSIYQGWDGDNLHLSNGEFMSIYDSKNLTKGSSGR